MKEHSYKNELIYSILETFNSDDIVDLCEELSIIEGEEIKCKETYEVRPQTYTFYGIKSLFFKIWLDENGIVTTICGYKEDYYSFYNTVIILSRNVKIKNILNA
jgi:hypothetical protein